MFQSAAPACLAAILAEGTVHAQQAAPGPAPTPQPLTAAENANRPRRGRYRLGPIYLTPSFRIGAIGFDTNVFYKPTDRQADVTGSGGPGLEVVAPLSGSLQLVVKGTLDYLHYVRTASLRRLTGSVDGGLELNGARTVASITETYGDSYARPSYEVDRRVLLSSEGTHARLRRRIVGRFTADLSGERLRQETQQGESFLGNDLHRTLTEDRYIARTVLEYAVTTKTSFLFEAVHRTDHFPVVSERDGRQIVLSAGIATTSTRLISGKASGGYGWFHSTALNLPDRRFVGADVDLMLHISPRTRLGGSYRRDLQYSAFETPGRRPTLLYEAIGAVVEKEVVGQRLLFRLRGTLTRIDSDSPVTVESADGRETALRGDKAKAGSAGLEYRFRPRFSVGVTAAYFGRRSNFAQLGVHGLLLGATASYRP
jgi:hypothetical protein